MYILLLLLSMYTTDERNKADGVPIDQFVTNEEN